jgi:hypothetical protein
MIIQKEYELMRFHERGILFDDIIIINGVRYLVVTHTAKWKDFRGGERIDEYYLEPFGEEIWHEESKMIFEFNDCQPNFGRGFSLNDVVFIDGSRYECTRTTHQMKDGNKVYECELVQMDKPSQSVTTAPNPVFTTVSSAIPLIITEMNYEEPNGGVLPVCEEGEDPRVYDEEDDEDE